MKRQRNLISETANRNIRGELLEAMSRERFVKGQRLASIREISQAYGVTKAIAERAVRGLIADGICYAEHGRGVFLAVDSSELRATSTVGIVFGGLESPANSFFRQLDEGTQGWVAKEGHNVLKLYSWYAKNAGIKAREWSQFSDRLAGVMVIGLYADADVILLRNSGLPVVVMDFDTRSLGVDSVVMDNEETMRQLTSRAIEKGAGELFLVLHARTTTSDPAPAERRKGFESAISRHKLAPSIARGVYTNLKDQACSDLLAQVVESAQKSEKPPAILAEDEWQFLSLVRSLKEHGLQCGKDFFGGCVAGEISAELAKTPASVALYDYQSIGAAAAKLLEDRMKSGSGRARTTVIAGKILETV
jgi:DNA-binding LacI/PurR family transcriptional regulator